MPPKPPRTSGCLLALAAATPAALQEAAPAPSASRPPVLVAATFYPWYDSATSDHLRTPEGEDLLRHHFADPGRVRPDSEEWYEQELADADAAGVDTLLVANVPAPARAERWMPALRRALERSRETRSRPVRVALLVDPYFVAVDRAGGEGGGAVGKLDLTDPLQRAQLVAPIERFFAAFPPDLVATIDGAPLVVVGPDRAVGARPDDLFEEIERAVAAIGGKPPHLVLEHSWNREDRPRWRAGAGLLGAQLFGEVATVAPGWSGRGGPPIVRPRMDGATYAAEWRRMLRARPRLVILESWNQMHDGTALCTALEHGRSYLDATRRFGDLLRAGEAPAGPGNSESAPTLLAESVARDRELAIADVARFLPDSERGGVRIDPRSVEPGSESVPRLSYGRDGGGAAVLVVAPRSDIAPAHLRFEISPVFVGDGQGELDVELDVELDLAEGSAPAQARVEESGRALRLEVAPGRGELRLRSIALRHRTGAPPQSRFGVSVSSLSEATDVEALAAARSLGARWLRLEVSWAALAPDRATLDLEPLEDALATIRAAGLEPVVALRDAPAWAQPLAAHPEVAAELVRKVARRLDRSLRLLELLPGANVAGEHPGVPDPQGCMRVMRAAARAAHASNPRLAIVLGAVAGADTTWMATLGALREPFVYDAVMLRANDEMGDPDGATFPHELDRFAAAQAGGSDAGKPLLLEIGATTAGSPLLASERRGLLPALVGTAWRRLDRAPTAVHLLHEPELPRVRGLAPGHARMLLEEGGIAVVARSQEELCDDLDAGAVSTLLLAGGEIAPHGLLARLPRYLDEGGLLVTLGGAPFRRSAAARPGGAFELLEDATPALTLRDDFRIALARSRPPAEGRPARAWTSGITVPGLAERFIPPPRDGAWFTRRTGLPRNEHGFHRYETLIAATGSETELGDVAALIAFTAARRGALLLIGVDAEDRGRSESEQAEALRRGFAAGLAAGARIVFWRGLVDAEGAAPGGALFHADGRPREAAAAFAAAAGGSRDLPERLRRK